MGKRWQSHRNDSGSLLASLFILALGASGSLFTVAAMSPSSMPKAMWIVGSVIAVFGVFIVLQRFGKVPSGDLRFLLSSQKNRRDDGVGDYLPRKVGEGRTMPEGTNQPISADEVHEIKVTSLNTWVPSQSRSRRGK